MFGGREGDGKKRIVNDIFIFDTGNIVTLFKPKIYKNPSGISQRWTNRNYLNLEWGIQVSYGTVAI